MFDGEIPMFSAIDVAARRCAMLRLLLGHRNLLHSGHETIYLWQVFYRFLSKLGWVFSRFLTEIWNSEGFSIDF